MEKFLDVIIVGGGLAGCTTALSLASLDPSLRLALIDDTEPGCFKIGESLPPESLRLLRNLHPALPGKFLSTPRLFIPCKGNASVWASQHLEDRPSILNPFGSGFHLDRARFDEFIREAFVSDDAHGDVMLVKAKFTAIERMTDGGPDTWTVRAKCDTGVDVALKARWIVDATGRKASVATKLGAKTVMTSPLLAFYAVFAAREDDVTDACAGADEKRDGKDTDTRTLIEACPTGWFYTSLVPFSTSPDEDDGQLRIARVVAYHTLPAHPSAKAARRPDGFLQLIHSSTTHVSAILQGSDYDMLPKYPKCTAAGSSHLDKVCGYQATIKSEGLSGWVAVGDAASAFDPLSAQGMMSALEGGNHVGRWLAQMLKSPTISSSTLGGAALQHPAQHATNSILAPSEVCPSITAMYAETRQEYERSRMYYYEIVKRFGDKGSAFWDRVL